MHIRVLGSGRRSKTVLAASAVCWLAAAGTASADLIYLEGESITGSGLGTVSTIIAFQSSANNTSSSAAIVADGGGQEIILGPNTTLAGGSNNQLRTLEEGNVTSGSTFRLLWNISEPGSETPPTVELLHLSAVFYAPDGSTIHEAVFDTATCASFDCMFLQQGAGTGSQGHVFGLSPGQAAIIDAAILTYGLGGIRVGVGTETNLVSLANESGGLETFNLASGGNVVTPEPASLLLFGVGLGVLGARARRRGRPSVQ